MFRRQRRHQRPRAIHDVLLVAPEACHRTGPQRRRDDLDADAGNLPRGESRKRLGGQPQPQLHRFQGRHMAYVVYRAGEGRLEDRLRDVEGRRPFRPRQARAGARPRKGLREAFNDESVRAMGRVAQGLAHVVRRRRNIRAERPVLCGVGRRAFLEEVGGQPDVRPRPARLVGP